MDRGGWCLIMESKKDVYRGDVEITEREMPEWWRRDSVATGGNLLKQVLR